MFFKPMVINRNSYYLSAKLSCLDDDWDKAVAGSPGGHFDQTTLWAKVKSFYGWTPVQLSLMQNNQLKCGALILLKQIGRLFTIGFISRGPFCLDGDEFWMQKMVEELELFAKAHRLAYLVVLPNYEGGYFHNLFLQQGYFEKPDTLPPSNLVTYTTLIDLSDDIDVIYSRMKRKTRYDIRRGLSDNVYVGLGQAADVETFRDLMWQLCIRRGVSPTPPQKDFFKRLWQVCNHSGYLKLFITYCENKPVAATMAFAFGNTLRVWKAGWSGEHATSRPNNVMYWEVIKWAKEKGFRYFDFVQIIPEHGKSLLQNEEISGPYAGVTRFKIGYGGRLVALPDPLCQSYLPLPRRLLGFGGEHLLSNPKIIDWVAMLLKKQMKRR